MSGGSFRRTKGLKFDEMCNRYGVGLGPMREAYFAAVPASTSSSRSDKGVPRGGSI